MSERRPKRRRSRLIVAGVVIAVALLLGWCGRGWFGGGSKGSDRATKAAEPPAEAKDAKEAKPASARCQLRVDASGVLANGDRVAIADAVAACKPLGEVELVVTGDAAYGTVQELEKALSDAGVRVYSARHTRPRDSE